MKSAYELAMERLEKESPSGPALTDEQKARIADINSLYESKIAEARILADEQKAKCTSMPELQQVEENLKTDIRRLEQECEEKKNDVRNESR